MADRYWVGGTGTWDGTNTANWSATSGGAGGASVPALNDMVYIDASSGGAGTIVTIATGYTPPNLNVVALSGTARLDINDNILTMQGFSSPGSNARGVDFGPLGEIRLLASVGGVWTTTSDNNSPTYTGSRNVYLTATPAAGGTRSITVTGSTSTNITTRLLNFYIQGGSDTVSFSGGASTPAVGNVDYTGFSGTSAPFGQIWGSLTFSPTMTPSTIASLTFANNTGAAVTLTTAGKTLDIGMTINCPTSSVTLLDNLTLTTNRTLFHSGGTLDFNNFNVSVGSFASTSGTRTLNTGTGTFNVTGNNATVWNYTVATSTVTGNRTVNFTYSGGTGSRTITNTTVTESTAFSMNITAGTDIIAVSGGVNDFNTTGFTGTLSNNTRSIFGNLVLGLGATLNSGTTATGFVSTSGTKTITTNGYALNFPITFNGAGGTWVLQDNFTVGNNTSSPLTLLAGTLDTNGKTINAFIFSTTGSATRSLIATGSTFNIVGNGGTVLQTAVTGLTITGLSAFNLTYSGGTGTRTLITGVLLEGTAPNVNVTAGTDIISLSGRYNDFNFSGFSGTFSSSDFQAYGNIELSSTMTVVAAGTTTTMLGSSGTKTFKSNNVSYQRILTFGSGGANTANTIFQLFDNANVSTANLNSGTLSLNNNTLTANVFSGSGTGTRVLDFGANSIFNITGSSSTLWAASTATGFSYTGNARVNFTANATTGNRAINHGVSGGTFATRPPPFYFTAGTDNLQIATNSIVGDLVFETPMTLLQGARTVFGNLILRSGMNVVAGANVTTLSSPTTQIFDTANITPTSLSITIGNGTSNGTVVLANSFVTANTNGLIVNSGTFDVNEKTLNVGTVTSTSGSLRQIDFSNTSIFISGTGTVWDMSPPANVTLVSSNSTIIVTDQSTTARTFNGGGLTYDNLVIGGTTGNSIFTINGNNTFNGTVSSTKTGPHTLRFNGGSVNTLGGFTVRGYPKNIVTLTSTTTVAHRLVLTGNTVINTVSYLNISYSNASPANTWYAGPASIESTNVTGWIFEQPSNYFLL